MILTKQLVYIFAFCLTCMVSGYFCLYANCILIMIFSSIFDEYSFLNNISLKLKDILEYQKHHIEPYLKLVIWTL